MALTLKAARVNKQLTQKEAAKAIGVTPETIGHWEKGKSFPNVHQIKTIISVYDVGFNDIIFYPDDVGKNEGR